MNRIKSRSQHGVSLIEALLALVVMAVGMLGVVGLQATLRSNGDLSRQRAEAVRLAQETLEAWRSFTRVESDVAQFDFTDQIVSETEPTVVTGVANTTFTREKLVTAAWPGMKTLSVRVTWQDRSGQNQEVALHSAVARVAPELAGSLAIPPQGAPARQPLGRHSAIPPSAVPQADGTWRFNPPPTAENRPAWFFNATTGLITRICTDASDLRTCSNATSQLLTGYVRFALQADQPTAAEPQSSFADLLPIISPATTLDAKVRFTTSSNPTMVTTSCFVGTTTSEPAAPTEYFCALPLAPSLPGEVPKWSGRLSFSTASTDTLPDKITDDAAEVSRYRLRVCRYFDLVDRVGAGSYTDVASPLANQNYLLIRAGSIPLPPPVPPPDERPPERFTCPAPITVAHPVT
jgi:Tfp pilus assembly protein PilV